jgi:hypothetical protein
MPLHRAAHDKADLAFEDVGVILVHDRSPMIGPRPALPACGDMAIRKQPMRGY